MFALNELYLICRMRIYQDIWGSGPAWMFCAGRYVVLFLAATFIVLEDHI